MALLAQSFFTAWSTGQTVDETYYSGIGYPAVRYHNYDYLREHPPFLMQLGATPLLVLQPNFPIDEPVLLSGPDDIDVSKTGAKFLYQSGNNAQLILFLQRVPIVLLMIFMGVLLFKWSTALSGYWGGVVSLTLLAFSPNMIANGSLYTTDMGVCVFIFSILFFLRKHLLSPSFKNAILCGFFCGIALVSKLSALVVIPLIPFFLFLYALDKNHQTPWFEIKTTKRKYLTALATALYIFCIGQKIMNVSLGPVCLILIYFYDLRYRKFSENLKNKMIGLLYLAGWVICVVSGVLLFKKLGARLPLGALLWILGSVGAIFIIHSKEKYSKWRGALCALGLIFLAGSITIIFSYVDWYKAILRFNPFNNFVFAFMLSMTHTQTNHLGCVDGSFVTCDWRYFISTMLIKTPVVTLLLSIIGGVVLLFKRMDLREKLLILLPIFILIFIASFLSKIYIGLRHVLPVYPFLFLLAGMIVPFVQSWKNVVFRKVGVLFLTLALVYLATSQLKVMPHYLSYFNEFVGSSENGAKIVAGSNFNWGQDNRAIAQWVKSNQIKNVKIGTGASNAALYDYHGIGWSYMQDEDFMQPKPGIYILDIAFYHVEQTKASSAFKGLEPVAKIGDTHYAFEIA